MYGRRHSPETILECLAWLAERKSLAAIHQVKGIREETVWEWLQEAAKQVEHIEALLLANYPLTRAELDAMRSYVGNKDEKGDTTRLHDTAESTCARHINSVSFLQKSDNDEKTQYTVGSSPTMCSSRYYLHDRSPTGVRFYPITPHKHEICMRICRRYSTIPRGERERFVNMA